MSPTRAADLSRNARVDGDRHERWPGVAEAQRPGLVHARLEVLDVEDAGGARAIGLPQELAFCSATAPWRASMGVSVHVSPASSPAGREPVDGGAPPPNEFGSCESSAARTSSAIRRSGPRAAPRPSGPVSGITDRDPARSVGTAEPSKRARRPSPSRMSAEA